MALANTIFTATSTVAVLATVWLDYLALGMAKETVNEAKASQAGRRGGQSRLSRARADVHRASNSSSRAMIAVPLACH
jgi:hypothetical protein